jgi:hypothetical protein
MEYFPSPLPIARIKIIHDVSEASFIRLLQVEGDRQTYPFLHIGYDIPICKDYQKVGIVSLYLKKQVVSETSVYCYA